MAIYRAEFSIAGVNAADGVLFNLKTAATDRAWLRQVSFFVEAAPTSPPIFGLKRMLAVGAGGTTITPALISDPADGAAAAGLETAWVTTRPTVTGGSAFRGQAALAIGNGVLFDFTARPIIVPISSGICGLMRNAAGATLGVIGGHVEWEE